MGATTETIKLRSKDDTRRGINSAKRNLSSLQKMARSARGGIAGIAGAAGVAALTSLTKKTLDAADAIEKLSRRSGGSARFLSEMRFGLSQNDITVNEFNKSLIKINKSTQDAADGLQAPARAFDKLGIKVEEFQRLNTDQKFITLSEAMSRVEDPAKRNQIAMDLMGRSGVQLLTVMEDGAQGIEMYRNQAEQMGLSLSETQVKGAAAANDAIDKLTSSISGSISQAILPYTDEIARAADFTREYLPKAIEFLINVFRGMKLAFQSVIFILIEGLLKVVELGEKLPKVGEKFKSMGDTLRGISLSMRDQISKNVDAMTGQGDAAEEAAKAQSTAADIVARKYTPAIIDTNRALIAQSKTAASTKEKTAELREEKARLAEQERILNAEAERYARATGQEFLRTQDQINRVLDEANLKTKNYNAGLEEAKRVIADRGLVEGTEQYRAALESLGFTLEDTAAKTENSTTTISELWKNSVGTVQGTLQELFEGGLNGFDGWFDSVLDSLKKFLAAFLAQWAASGILTLAKSFGSQGGLDFSGFSLSNAFGSGGGNGSGTVQAGAAVAGQIFGQQAGQTFNTVATGAGGIGGVIGGVNSIDAGLEQGGTSGAISVVSGLASVYQGATTIAGLLSGGTATAAAAAGSAAAAGAAGAAAAGAAGTAAAGAATAAAATAAGTAAAGAGAAAAATAAGAGAAAAAGAGAAAAGAGAATASAAAASGSAAAAGTAAAGAGAGIGQALLVAAPYLAAVVAVVALLSGNSRSFDEIVEQDYLPDLLGQNIPNEALGANGETGFNGGNTGIFGANFGIQGSGITSQLLVDGGANGNGGFFNGAQKNLEEFAEVLKANGIEAKIAHGTLRALSRDNSKTAEDIKNLWQEYANGITEAVKFTDVYATATENNLIRPTNLFFENFALGFGQSAFEARDSLLEIRRNMSGFVEDGQDKTKALTQAFSDFYGLTEQQTVEFFTQAGLSIEKMAEQFGEATDASLTEMLDFNADGLTALEQLVQGATTAANDMAGAFSGALNGVNLGTPQAINIPTVSVGAVRQQASNDPFLGSFNKGGRFIVPGAGNVDRPFRINLTPGEEVEVKPKSETSVRSQANPMGGRDELIDAIYDLVEALGENDESNKRMKGLKYGT